MTSLLTGGSTTPAVRKPAFTVSFGSASSDDWAKSLASVSVEAGLAPAVDVAEVVFSSRDDAPKVSLGQTGSVALGFDDSSPSAVFSGEVRALHHTVSGTSRLLASNGGAALAALRVDQGYEQQGAGDIVKDLAGRTSTTVNATGSGPTLPYYVVDSRSTAWEHVAKLAALSGFAAWLAPDGGLHFGPLQAGSPAQTFTYGQDILAIDAQEAAPLPGEVVVVGEGAAGSQGSDAWSWTINDALPVTGSAGSGDPSVLVQDGALRSADAVNGAAQGIATNAKLGALTARLLVTGAPAATVGATVSVAGAPDDTLNGSWIVRGVRHRLVKTRGYTSLLLLAKGDT